MPYASDDAVCEVALAGAVCLAAVLSSADGAGDGHAGIVTIALLGDAVDGELATDPPVAAEVEPVLDRMTRPFTRGQGLSAPPCSSRRIATSR